ncbi:MAG: serine--tRNA ligase [Patescibacteria group bacterium]|nr:serine--tRNA ligase [Patescibacteria group bacterium]
MIDIKLIRENPEAVKAGCRAKNADVDIDAVIRLDAERRELIQKSEGLKAQQNRESEEVAKAAPAERAAKIEALKKIKDEFRALEARLDATSAELDKLLRLIPNLPRPDVKVGKDDSENFVISTFMEPTKFDFDPKDYMTLGEKLGIIDVERAGKVSGARFGFLLREGALLEFALVQYAMKTLLPEGFAPVVPPVMINEKAMGGMGYLDRGRDEIYHLAEDNLFLVGTSEQVIGAMHMDEIMNEVDLPLRYVGFSSCFRREAGSYGKDVRGILRVHQFDKLEMFSFTTPEVSDKEHEFLRSMEERLLQGLKLPHHVLGICSGDLGDPAARKWDLETWIPSQNTYRETHSTSTCTDYQARRLNIRLRRKDGTVEILHTLNGTAFAIGRTIIAILENYQQADGSIRVPEALQPYMNGITVIGPR